MIGRGNHSRFAAASLVLIAATTLLFGPCAGSAQTSPPTANKRKANKPLAGYNAVLVEPFTLEQSTATKDFPAGEEANLQLSTITGLRASKIFGTVIDAGTKPAEASPSSETAAKEGTRRLILSGSVIGFSKGDSAARFVMWPLPVGVSKATARFVFRDAESNQEVFRCEKEAKFQAAGSVGIATKEQQMSHVKGGLVDALIKEIKRNR